MEKKICVCSSLIKIDNFSVQFSTYRVRICSTAEFIFVVEPEAQVFTTFGENLKTQDFNTAHRLFFTYETRF